MNADRSRTVAAYEIWRHLGRGGMADVSLANRLAPVALAYWAAPEPDPAVVVRR